MVQKHGLETCTFFSIQFTLAKNPVMPPLLLLSSKGQKIHPEFCCIKYGMVWFLLIVQQGEVF